MTDLDYECYGFGAKPIFAFIQSQYIYKLPPDAELEALAWPGTKLWQPHTNEPAMPGWVVFPASLTDDDWLYWALKAASVHPEVADGTQLRMGL